MPNCKVNVDAKANPLAHGIYQDLNKLGVSCEMMDQGYNVTNYAGKYCTDKTARNCILSKGDGVVGSDEVLEYALGGYDKYRQVIEGRLGSPLPWVLDDLDPKTTFDAEIRAKVDAVIKELKKIITSKGITEGSPEYKEKLAAGLTWFVAAPTADAISMGRAQGSPWIQLLEEGMKKDGLYDAHVKGLATALIPHWEQKDVKPMADRFHIDTSVKVPEAIARMILCYAFWQKGDKDEALEKFGDLTMEFAPTQKPSPSTTEFLKKILEAMPGDMKRDKRAKDAIKSLNRYQ